MLFPTIPKWMPTKHDELLPVAAYKAKYPFTALADGDLTLKEGDVVVVMDTMENGWWRGICNRRSGWFPASYVEVVPEVNASQNIHGTYVFVTG